MRILLFFISAFIAFNANARFRTFTSAGVHVLGDPDCIVYHVSIWQDYGSDDPRTWKKLAEKHIWSDGCDFGADDPNPSQYNFPASDNFSFITSSTESGGCTVFEIQINAPDGTDLASGMINSCNDAPLAMKKALEQNSEVISKKTIEVFPSIVTDEVNVTGFAQNKLYKIDLFDLSGKLMLTNNVMLQDNILLNVASLKPGVYFIQISTNGNTIKKRIIKS
jgi:hypothetical protein